MEPHRVLFCSKVAEVVVEAVAKVVASAQDKKGQDSSEVDCFRAIVVVHDEDIDQRTHSSAHTQWADHERPYDLVNQIFGTAHDQNGDREEENFGQEGIEIEQDKGSKVYGSSFTSYMDVILSCNDGLKFDRRHICVLLRRKGFCDDIYYASNNFLYCSSDARTLAASRLDEKI